MEVAPQRQRSAAETAEETVAARRQRPVVAKTLPQAATAEEEATAAARMQPVALPKSPATVMEEEATAKVEAKGSATAAEVTETEAATR